MSERKERDSRSSAALGVFLILLGSLFLLDQLLIIDFGDAIETWWPSLIIAFGITKMIGRRSLSAGGWAVFVGLWLQTVELSLFGLTYGNSWPVFVIAVGAIMIVQGLREPFRGRSDDGLARRGDE